MKRKHSKSKKKGLLANISIWTFRSTMVLLTGLLCLLLILSAYSDLINPNTWIVPSFLGIAFGVLSILCAVWCVVLSLTRQLRCLIAMAVAFGLVFMPLMRYSPFHLSDNDPVTSTDDGREIEHIERIKVMSYNTCLMGHANMQDKTKSLPILDVLRQSDADIVCIQEYTTSLAKNGYSIEVLRQRMKDLYPYSDFTPYSYSHRSGIAVLSKYPIRTVDRIDHRKKGYISATYYQIEAESRTFALVNMHLQSNKLSQEDRQLYDDMIGHFAADSLQRIRKGLLHSLAVAWRQRANEVDMIRTYVEQNHPQNMPLMICGDMNDTPVSYSSYTLRQLDLTDTWQETGFGPGITYSEHRFWFRIDHIFHSQGLRALKMQVRKDIKLSDHYPVEATFQLLPQ